MALNIKPKHIIAASKLDTSAIDKYHSDPFDRLLLSQARSENFTFLTHDEKMSFYNEKCVTMV